MRQDKAHRDSKDADERTDVGTEPDARQQHREKLADDTDATLDDIDDVLEDNAEEFVRSYVQKGGE